MDRQFLVYTVEQLVDEPAFVAWVVKREHHEEWSRLALLYPDFEKRMQLAEQIVEQLLAKDRELSQTEIDGMWERIVRFDEKHKATLARRRWVTGMMKAAAALLVFGLTAWFFFRQIEQKNTGYTFSESSEALAPVLKLQGGDEISLAEDSVIALTGEHIHIGSERVLNFSARQAEEPSAMNEVSVPFGRRTHIVLEDGTAVWLNADSRLAFPTEFADNERIVYLEGRAYFEVKPDHERPFFVKVTGMDVRVLGTKFDLTAYPEEDRVETALLEGSVGITEDGNRSGRDLMTVLEPNQKAIFSRKDKRTSVIDDPGIQSSNSWIYGWLTFSKQNLSDVLSSLERYYNVRFEYRSSTETDERFTGKLALRDSIDDILATLTDLGYLGFEKIDSKTILVTRKTSGN